MHDAVQKPLMDEIAKSKDFKGKSAPITSLVLLLQALAQEDCSSQLKRMASALERMPTAGTDGNTGGKSKEDNSSAGTGGDQILEWLDRLQGGDSGGAWYEALDIDEKSLAFLGGIIQKTKETIDIWNPFSYGLQNLLALNVENGVFPAANIKQIMKIAKLARKYKPLIEKLLPIVMSHLPKIAKSFSAPPKESDSASLSEHYPDVGAFFKNLHVAIQEPTIIRANENDVIVDPGFGGPVSSESNSVEHEYVEPELTG